MGFVTTVIENTFQIPQVLQTGMKLGMRSMDYSLFELFQEEKITEEVALRFIKDVQLLKMVKQKRLDEEAAAAAAAEELANPKKKGWFK